MRHTRRAVIGAAAAATTGLAGCTGSQDGGSGGDGGDGGDDGDGGGGTDPTSTPTPTDTVTPTPEPVATVRVRSHAGLGELLAGPDGRTLYMFDRDTKGSGTSACRGDCANAWPPLTVETDPAAGDGVTAELTTVERQDGTTQVAAAGWPLYYFADDEGPGETNGQGAGGVWWVLGPDGTPKRPEPTPTSEPSATVRVRSHPDHGELLVGPDGHTLYMFDRDTKSSGTSACRGDCADAWPPLTVETDPAAGDGVTAELTTVERSDGGTQVVAGGWPLYYFADDEGPGETNGQGAGGVWWVLGPGGTPKRSDATPTPTPTSGGGMY